jgi:hypothetical protein
MFITLQEIRSAIETLAGDKDFKLFLVNQPALFKKELDQLKKKLDLTKETIKDIRNDIGAHISDESIKETLQNMSYERLGILQISQYDPRKTHYKFAGELITAILLRNASNEQKEDKANEIISMLVNTLKELFVLIDRLFFAYAKDRKLL